MCTPDYSAKRRHPQSCCRPWAIHWASLVLLGADVGLHHRSGSLPLLLGHLAGAAGRRRAGDDSFGGEFSEAAGFPKSIAFGRDPELFIQQ